MNIKQCRHIIYSDHHLTNKKVKNINVLMSHFIKTYINLCFITNVAQKQQPKVKECNLNLLTKDSKFT